MADPYSERFAIAHRPGSPTRAYTVPGGKRAIVRSFTYAGYLATAPAIWLQLAGHYLFVAQPPGATFGGNVELYQVVYAGELIVIDCTASAGDVWAAASGYLLDDPAGARAALDVDAGPGMPVRYADPPWAASDAGA